MKIKTYLLRHQANAALSASAGSLAPSRSQAPVAKAWKRTTKWTLRRVDQILAEKSWVRKQAKKWPENEDQRLSLMEIKVAKTAEI